MPPVRTVLLAGAVLIGAAAAPSLAAAQDQQVVAYTSTTLNLRDGPGTEFSVIVSMPSGAQVVVTYCSNDENWCFMQYGQYAGWASSRYLTTTAPQVAQAPQPQYQAPQQQPYVAQYPETTYYPQQPQVAVPQPPYGQPTYPPQTYPPQTYPPQTYPPATGYYPPQTYPPQPVYPPLQVYPPQQQVIVVRPGPRYWVGTYGWWQLWFR